MSAALTLSLLLTTLAAPAEGSSPSPAPEATPAPASGPAKAAETAHRAPAEAKGAHGAPGPAANAHEASADHAPAGAHGAGGHAPDPDAFQPTLPVRHTPTLAMHPDVPLLDAEGAPVARSGRPLSLLKSCGGGCHDTAYITAHSYHSWLGADEPAASGEPFDQSAGNFGRWDPLRYARISPAGEARPDLSLPQWLTRFGVRHAGGGPAQALGVEMNCLICHSERMNDAGRARALADGALPWASTASLPAPLASRGPDGWTYTASAFGPHGEVSAAQLGLSEPTTQTCGRCHGEVPKPGEAPVQLARDPLHPDPAAATGLIYSAQRMRVSGLNLQDKPKLSRSFDIHAERLLDCVDCHHSVNNPTQRAESAFTRPNHLRYDARRQRLRTFLKRPLHQFARGDGAQGTIARKLSGSMRGCTDCHDANEGHDWLPYAARHFAAMRCESCHIPKIHTPLLQAMDWTLLDPNGAARVEYRGGSGANPGELIRPFTPALLARAPAGQGAQLTPHNLVTSFYWQESDPTRPVRLTDLKAAMFAGDGAYAAPILAALDADHDGRLSEAERVLDTPAKVAAVKTRLEAVGVKAPKLAARVQPYTLSHAVTGGDFATASCDQCHGEASQLTAPVDLAARSPFGVTPVLVADAQLSLPGELDRTEAGAWRYAPAPKRIYVFGHSASPLLDNLGLAMLGLVFLGVSVHGGARLWTERRRRS